MTRNRLGIRSSGPGTSGFIETLEPRRMLVVPQVLAAQFQFLNSAQRITVQFNTDVSASLGAADLQLQNHTSLTRVSNASIALQNYNPATNTATFTFPGLPAGTLANGNYRLRVLAPGVTSGTGEVMSADGVLDFFVLGADADHNRSVNVDDFGVLAGNFNAPGTFANGDFNYSGTTDIDDFGLLASRFNTALPALAAPTTRYSVFVLPEVAGFNVDLVPYAFNDNGMVVGQRSDYNASAFRTSFRAFSWQPGQTSLTFRQQTSSATGVNDSGTIVGYRTNNGRLAIRYTQSTALGSETVLNNTTNNPDFGSARALGINNAGTIVGTDDDPPGPLPPIGVRWTQPSVAEVIGGQYITSINETGDMAGEGPAFYPVGGAPVQISPAGGLAMGVNASQEVVGVVGGTIEINPTQAKTPYGTTGKPFYWKPGMVEPFLLENPVTPNPSPRQARAINNAGQIVGSDNFGGIDEGTIFHQGFGYPLNTMLVPGTDPTVRILGASDIRDDGAILAYGEFSGVQGTVISAFILTPVAPRAASASSPVQNDGSAPTGAPAARQLPVEPVDLERIAGLVLGES